MDCFFKKISKRKGAYTKDTERAGEKGVFEDASEISPEKPEEGVSADESAVTEEAVSTNKSTSAEGDSSLEEPAPSDDSNPSMDADLVESDPTADEAENAVVKENADSHKDAGCASVAEDAASYTATEQTEFSEKVEVEEPPEEPTQDTE